MGTSVGAKLYTLGGWEVSSGFSVGLLGLSFLVLFARGPHATKWIGWDGGSSLRKATKAMDAEEAVVEEGSGSKGDGKEDVVMVELGQDDPPERKGTSSMPNRPS